MNYKNFGDFVNENYKAILEGEENKVTTDAGTLTKFKQVMYFLKTKDVPVDNLDLNAGKAMFVGKDDKEYKLQVAKGGVNVTNEKGETVFIETGDLKTKITELI